METLAPRHYFDAALLILGSQGPEALTIASLCAALDISKGSFYHHFNGMPGFVDALLAFWEDEHSDRLIALSAQETDPAQRMRLLVGISLTLPHDAEAAFRAWSRSNPSVAATQQRVDDRREATLVQTVRAMGATKAEATLHAKMAMAILIGLQQRERPVNPRLLRRMLETLNAPLTERLAG